MLVLVVIVVVVALLLWSVAFALVVASCWVWLLLVGLFVAGHVSLASDLKGSSLVADSECGRAASEFVNTKEHREKETRINGGDGRITTAVGQTVKKYK